MIDSDIAVLSHTYENMFEQLGLNISGKYKVLGENFISWNRDQDLKTLADSLHDTGRKLLLAWDSNPTIRFDTLHSRQYLLELAQEFDDQVKILYHDIQTLFESSDFVYFPTFFVQQRSMFDHQQNAAKQWRFSFLSGQMRFHRLWFFQQVKSEITDRDCFAVNADVWRDADHNFMVSYSRLLLGQEVDLMANLPFAHDHAHDNFYKPETEEPYRVDWSNGHPAYAAVFNISGESVCEDDQVFFTEKTWKSIRSRCLHIDLGSQRSNFYLRKLGFFTDHDVDLSVVDKIKWIADKMQQWPWDYSQQIYREHTDLINHNYHRFYSVELRDLFANYLRDRLQL